MRINGYLALEKDPTRRTWSRIRGRTYNNRASCCGYHWRRIFFFGLQILSVNGTSLPSTSINFKNCAWASFASLSPRIACIAWNKAASIQRTLPTLLSSMKMRPNFRVAKRSVAVFKSMAPELPTTAPKTGCLWHQGKLHLVHFCRHVVRNAQLYKLVEVAGV